MGMKRGYIVFMSDTRLRLDNRIMGLSFRGFDGSKKGLLTFHIASAPYVFKTRDSAKRAASRTVKKKGFSLDKIVMVELAT